MKFCLNCNIELTVKMFADHWMFNRAKYCGRACYLSRHKIKKEKRKCEHCQKEFEINVQIPTRTCSTACSYEIRKVYGSKYITTQGYIAIKTHSPWSDENGYELEHRMIIQNEIGRKLTEEEHVHHINGNKTDNRRENLNVLLNGDHQREHESHIRLNTPEAIAKRVETRWGN